MKIQSLVVSPFEENCYIVWDDTDKNRGVVVDPGDEGPRIIETIERLGVTPEAILITHGHGDHIGAIADVKERYKIPIYIGRGEEEMLTDPRKNLSFRYGAGITAPPADFLLDDDESVTLAGMTFRIMAVPGHSPASIAYHSGEVVFSGDALFMGSIGRTDFPGSDYETLMRSITEKLFTLADTTVVCSGHGPATTIGREKQSNQFVREYLNRRGR